MPPEEGRNPDTNSRDATHHHGSVTAKPQGTPAREVQISPLALPLPLLRINAVAFALFQRPCGMLIAKMDNAEAPQITRTAPKKPMSVK